MIESIVKYVQLFVLVIIAMWMVYSGMMKLVGFPGMEESFLAWGYGYTFMIVIGVVEIILGVALFAKPTRIYAYIGLMVLMFGALYTHISHYEYEEVGPATYILMATCLMLANDRLHLTKMIDDYLSKK